MTRTQNGHMKKYGYTWEDLDKAWWEGFDCCKEKLETQLKQTKEYLEQALPYLEYLDEESDELCDKIKEFIKEG